MALNRQKSFIAVDDYLAAEKDGDIRHEYIDGDVYAMTGGSRRHSAIVFNIGGLLYRGLKFPCQGYVSDMKVHIKTPHSEKFYYPDVSVDCEEETADDYYIERPVLIMEVLSPSTERMEKYEKRFGYQQIESLQEYVLVYQDRREIWIWRRTDQWEKEVYNEGEIALRSIGVTIAIDDVYRNVGV